MKKDQISSFFNKNARKQQRRRCYEKIGREEKQEQEIEEKKLTDPKNRDREKSRFEDSSSLERWLGFLKLGQNRTTPCASRSWGFSLITREDAWMTGRRPQFIVGRLVLYNLGSCESVIPCLFRGPIGWTSLFRTVGARVWCENFECHRWICGCVFYYSTSVRVGFQLAGHLLEIAQSLFSLQLQVWVIVGSRDANCKSGVHVHGGFYP